MKKMFFAILAISLIIFLYFHFFKEDKVELDMESFSKLRETHTKPTGFINPILYYDINQIFYKNGTKEIKRKIQSIINEYISKNYAGKVGVYFRDLQDGPWFGINQDDKFFPASLIKVPVMIAALKRSESDPDFLSKELIFEEYLEDSNKEQYFQPKNPIKKGEKYTVDKLINSMIIDSDNNAYALLQLELGKSSIDNVFSDFGFSAPPTSTDDVYSPHDYAAFFRVLYNASYLNRKNSIKSLEILSKTNFKEGIVAGVPQNTIVAHKFGNLIHGTQIELHDCGIVYYPNNAYLLCVMTEGSDLLRLESLIKNISKEVWSEVDKQVNRQIKRNKK